MHRHLCLICILFIGTLLHLLRLRLTRLSCVLGTFCIALQSGRTRILRPGILRPGVLRLSIFFRIACCRCRLFLRLRLIRRLTR